ncbi:hypothetical protein PsorP6_009086 [Peronosclerospora sorghi]|uniref:Uncharacterized protein n=1 Tax=Peronosclerospora sorghi TaxID=230839 RepID=A0ACC0W203_9STRA|nr:hypothetical protein PsorP6_009086 [Peronosclerospora sorghi]
METLFGNHPSEAMRNQGHSTALVSSSRSDSESALQCVYDNETNNCMNCNTPFTMFTRKVAALILLVSYDGLIKLISAITRLQHHCRRCKMLCVTTALRTSAAFRLRIPNRVCITCYAAVDKHFASLKWLGHSSVEARYRYSTIQSKPDPVIEGRVLIGQLYVKVVEAIGLPSTDSITSDPFVRIVLTRKWSHRQEWGNDLKKVKCTKKKSRTLNPRWHETFVFNVCAPCAELILEVYNHCQLSQPTKLGEATIPLSQIMDHRRHNKWLDLLLPEEFHRVGLNNDARAGRIHDLLD